MLTLAAMRVIGDTKDPYFTSLQAGAYDKVKPKGKPCDSAFKEGCQGPRLGKKATLALAIVITVVGFIIVGLSIWYILLLVRSSRSGKIG
jgi:endoglucanase